MKKRKLFVSLVCVLLALLMAFSLILSVIPARAISQTDIELLQEKRARLEQQLSDQAAVIETLSANQSLIVDRKAALDQQIALNRESIALMEEELSLYDALIAEKERELSAAQTAEAEQTERFRSRVRAMEENGNYSYLTFLFESDSFTELLSRLGDISDIMHYDRQLEEDLRSASAQVAALKGEYEQIWVSQNAVKRELDEKKLQLNAQVDAACSLIANLDALSSDAQAEYAAIEAAEAEARAQELRALAQYAAEQEAARQAAWAAYLAANPTVSTGAVTTVSSGGTVANGDFIWPVDSTYITSNFGYRAAPTAGASTFHQAVDISAPAGSPIYAVADGQVVVASVNSGLGNYVSIAHDGDTSTRYSHMTNYVVQPGEYVTQGQVIGYVGATGIATGNHLDFAVTQNGQQVDPLQFYDSSALTFDPTA